MTEDEYFITKGGAYYRPKAQGYTTCQGEAGRFSLEDAIRYSHPNGPDGPRDGIRYEKAPPKAQADDELVEIAAKILIQSEPLWAGIQWERIPSDVQKRAFASATAVLAAVTTQIEARVTGEIVAWLRGERGEWFGLHPSTQNALADRIEHGDYKESQP